MASLARYADCLRCCLRRLWSCHYVRPASNDAPMSLLAVAGFCPADLGVAVGPSSSKCGCSLQNGKIWWGGIRISGRWRTIEAKEHLNCVFPLAQDQVQSELCSHGTKAHLKILEMDTRHSLRGTNFTTSAWLNYLKWQSSCEGLTTLVSSMVGPFHGRRTGTTTSRPDTAG